ncbi:hypothetical protein E2C01_055344 [Portunus trituberculatus]|uniref:Uncharacterized protein n=1 Tax=Portunus trituberculatus TaxID=210409 RepID=A0A5B7GV10_PORTR|nr:hypothetical protein [Portunus trituberculatus]
MVCLRDVRRLLVPHPSVHKKSDLVRLEEGRLDTLGWVGFTAFNTGRVRGGGRVWAGRGNVDLPAMLPLFSILATFASHSLIELPRHHPS